MVSITLDAMKSAPDTSVENILLAAIPHEATALVGFRENNMEILISVIVSWVNYVTNEIRDTERIEVKSSDDLIDGWTLPVLLNILSRSEFSLRKLKNPAKAFLRSKTRDENLSACLKFLEEKKKLYLPEINTDNIKTDVVKRTTLLVKVILYYDIEVPLHQTLAQTSHYNVHRPDAKDILLRWMNDKLREIGIGGTRNFTSDWRDGIRLGALINYIDPGLCSDWPKWDPRKAAANITHAMKTANKYFEIPNLLTPTRMCCDDLDETCVIIYLAQFTALPANRASGISYISTYFYSKDTYEDNVDTDETTPKEMPDYDSVGRVNGSGWSLRARNGDIRRPGSFRVSRKGAPPKNDYTRQPGPNMPTAAAAAAAAAAVMTDYSDNSYLEPPLRPTQFPGTEPKPPETSDADFWNGVENGDQIKEQLKPSTKNANDFDIGNKKIGEGEYGIVYPARLRIGPDRGAVPMAAKAIRFHDPNIVKRFLEEAVTMQNFKHDHVLGLEAFIVRGGTPYILVEHMERGDLLSHLRKNKTRLQVELLMHYTLQVASGMEYLSNLRFVHRDLAARNCMVNQKGVVKVGDFGFTRDILSEGIYQMTSDYRIPIAWLALEVIVNKTFTIQSDVWAFGILCYEVMTYGGIPYNFPCSEIEGFLKEGKRLEKPPDAPSSIYKMMRDCWETDPAKRPTFSEIKNTLEDLLGLNEYGYDTVNIPYLNRSNLDQHGPRAPDTGPRGPPTPPGNNWTTPKNFPGHMGTGPSTGGSPRFGNFNQPGPSLPPRPSHF